MKVTRATSDEERSDALSVRRTVFIDEQGVPEKLELDGRDDESTQFAAYVDGAAVGAARLREYEGAAKIERVAVLESHRGRGIGAELMEVVESTAREEGYDRAVLHAQVPVVAFYRKLGYEVTSEEFMDAGIPHHEMEKPL